jgi:hypothetical protein
MRPEIEYVETPSLVGARPLGPRDIPGSECVGNGYNVFDGDYASPLSTTFQLFDLSNKTELQIDESHTYNVPTNVTFKPYRQGDFRITTGKTIEEHQSSLLVKTGISGKYMGFKGSLDVSFDRSAFRRSSFEYATCMDVIARWILRLPHPTELGSILLPHVEAEMSSLPPRELFEKYGTHYLWEIIVGARATYSSAINTLLYKSEYAVEVIAEMSYKFMIGRVSASIRTKYEESVSNFQSNSSSRVRIVGGDPGYAKQIFDGEYDDWIESTDERPVFVGFGPKGLRPIWELCGDESRTAQLQEAYAAYAMDKSKPLQRFPLQTGDLIALQADTGAYLSRIGEQGIEASKPGIDEFSRFTVTVVGDGEIALQADTGKYLSRINRGPGKDPIEAAKTFVDRIAIDPFSRFTVTYFEEENRIALQADTGKYLSRINRGPGKDPIEAAKTTIDPYCKFSVHIL